MIEEKDTGSTLITDLILSRNEQLVCGLTGGREVVIYTWKNVDFPIEALRFEIPKSEFPADVDSDNLNGINIASFMEGDRFIALGQECGVISVWRLFSENDVMLRNPECVLQFCPLPEPVTSIAYAPQSNSLAVSYRAGVVKILLLPDLQDLEASKSHVFTILAQGPTSIGDKYVDQTTAVSKRRKKAGTSLAGRWKCLNVHFSPNGKFLYVLESSDSGAACISKWCYSMTSAQGKNKKGGKISAIESVTWTSKTSDYFESAFVGSLSDTEPDPSLDAWTLVSNTLASKGSLGCMAVALSDANNVYNTDLLAVGAGDGTISLFEGLDMKRCWSTVASPDGNYVQGLAFVQDEEIVIGVSADGRIIALTAHVKKQTKRSLLQTCIWLIFALVVLQIALWCILIRLSDEALESTKAM